MTLWARLPLKIVLAGLVPETTRAHGPIAADRIGRVPAPGLLFSGRRYTTARHCSPTLGA